MRRLRAGTDVPPLPGGPGTRSGSTTAAPQGACWTGTAPMIVGPPKRRPPTRGRRQGPPDRSRNQETRTRGTEIAAMERREAPAFLARGARQDGRLVRRSVLHSLGWARGENRQDGVPGAAQRIRAMKHARFLIPPLKGEGPARSAGGGVMQSIERKLTPPGSHRALRDASHPPRKAGRD